MRDELAPVKSDVLTSTLCQVRRENDIIYMKSVPRELPELPEGKRLAAATTFTLPPAAPAQPWLAALQSAPAAEPERVRHLTALLDVYSLQLPHHKHPAGAGARADVQLQQGAWAAGR